MYIERKVYANVITVTEFNFFICIANKVNIQYQFFTGLYKILTLHPCYVCALHTHVATCVAGCNKNVL